MRQAWRKTALLWLLLSLTLAILGAMLAFWSAGNKLQQSLSEQLPQRLADTLQYSFISDAEAITHVSALLDQDLAQLNISGNPAFLHDCQAGLLRLAAQYPAWASSNASGLLRSTIEVSWDYGQYPETAEFMLSCHVNTPVASSTGALLGLLVVALLLLVPDNLSAPRRLVWFSRALNSGGFNARGLRQALRAALAPAVIEFNFRNYSVVIHGLTVNLPKTPFFYYAWYALQRQSGNSDGWLLNPATDRPDRELAESLIRLMATCGGHQKAINDLREHGVRAKILDQNRNKVKDELIRALGDELAGNFLFESERDPRSARYRYRLLCPPAMIRTRGKPANTSEAHPTPSAKPL